MTTLRRDLTATIAQRPDWAPDYLPPEWYADALCAETDPQIFFPEAGGSTRAAKKVCASCPVRVECLEYALAHKDAFGIWGGVSERDRRKIVREREAS